MSNLKVQFYTAYCQAWWFLLKTISSSTEQSQSVVKWLFTWAIAIGFGLYRGRLTVGPSVASKPAWTWAASRRPPAAQPRVAADRPQFDSEKRRRSSIASSPLPALCAYLVVLWSVLNVEFHTVNFYRHSIFGLLTSTWKFELSLKIWNKKPPKLCFGRNWIIPW